MMRSVVGSLIVGAALWAGACGDSGVVPPTSDVRGNPQVVFSSAWGTATGSQQAAITDGGAWDELFGCSRTDVLSVVAGAPLGWTRTPNIFRVQEIGNLACGAVQKRNVVPASTTHWGRMYFRNDETTQRLSFHNFNYNFVGDIQFIFFNRRATNTGFELDVRMPAAYPFNIWRLQTGVGPDAFNPPIVNLQNGVWYRYEWQVEYLSANRMRFWPRVYTNGGQLLYDSDDFYQIDNPGSGSNSLTTWYAAGNAFTVRDLQLARHVGVGNEGRGVGPQPGQSWYVADFAISTAGWIGQ